jgi:hypothetical protein
MARDLDKTSCNLTNFTAAAMSNMQRKGPNEEFFTLCLLALKMKNKNRPEIMTLKTRDLWQKALKDSKLEFTDYPDWLDKEVGRLKYLAKHKHQLQRDQFASSMKQCKKERELTPKRGVKYVKHFIRVD